VSEAQAVSQIGHAAGDGTAAGRGAARQMGESLHGTATRTARSLGELQQRLETIDKAQANIEKLSGNVLNLAGYPVQQADARRLWRNSAA
jgi:DNA recombination protein RmuC